jgi:DNA repair protein RecO (recombination protein O)
MELWEDQGIVLAARSHGENGAVVSLLTEERGRHAGYVRGAHAGKNRGALEPGNLVDARWQSRVEGQLGSLTLELQKNPGARYMADPLRLAALQSACALCDAALPEREGHPGLFHGLLALTEALDTEVWGPAYVMWEIAFLKELGFSLDLSKCAGGGDTRDLMYVSPKTGRAVSEAMGRIYKDKLLLLPEFLRPSAGDGGDEDVLTGLKLTGYFLEHWVFAHYTQGLPEIRLRLHKRVLHEFERAEGLKPVESL